MAYVYQNTVVQRTVDASVATSTSIAPTEVNLELLDIPRVPWDANANFDFLYAAVWGRIFYGANIFKTYDDGASWTLISVISAQSIMGNTISKLEPGFPYYFDEKNSFNVKMNYGTLSSRTEAEIYNGYNMALVGNEIIQFRNAVLIQGDGTYRISGLLRGCLGTDDQIATHLANERFVMLSFNNVDRVDTPAIERVADKDYRYGPGTKAVTDALYVEKSFTSTGRSHKHWSVCQVTGTRDDDGNLTITWVPRSKSAAGWLDFTEVPLDSKEIFDVEILDSYGIVLRTIRTTDAYTLEYTMIQQTEDFGATVPTSIYIRIYQVNATVGRGIKKDAKV
jgi:hypothetical protein